MSNDNNSIENKPFTVSELNREIRNLLEAELSSVWVVGEISNLRTPSSGHSYFTLKDQGAQLKAVFFKGLKSFLRFDMEDGQEVLARGRITVYEPRGDYQIIVDYLEPKGYGALQKAFEQLKEKLSKEGLFDERHKKPIPFLPKKIGIVTSETGAAIKDILQIVDRRFHEMGVLVAPVKVQGEGAAEEIADAIRDMNRNGETDVLIVGRGGGSLEDLWPFNEEIVARAIFESKIPVISAVGHEIDFTISDFVADLRAPTPSAAAELAVPVKSDLHENLLSLWNSLVRIMRSSLETQKASLNKLMERRFFQEPGVIYEAAGQRLDYLTMELERNITQVIQEQKHQCQNLSRSLELLSPWKKIRSLEEKVDYFSRALDEKMKRVILSKKGILENETNQLDALSPLSTLSRGFSVCRTPDNKVVKESGQVKTGDKLNLLLHKGELLCEVEKKLP